MENIFSKAGFLDGTTLKIIAIISMTIDHIGYIFFPHIMILRYLGRLAFPIFAYMIAEGCYYTKNKRKYILLILAIGIICQAAMIIAQNDFELNIMFTFAVSIAIIYLLQWALGRREVFTTAGGDITHVDTKGVSDAVRWLIFIIVVCATIFLAVAGPKLFPGFKFEYRVFGVFLAVVIYLPRERYQKFIVTALWLIFLCMDLPARMQWYCLFALLPLFFYNEQPGKHRMKYFFYFYYPVHLAILWGLKLFIFN